MKTLQRTIVILLAAVMALTMASCSKASPTDVVTRQMDDVKNEKMEEDMSALIGDEAIAKKYGDKYEKLLTMFRDFDYEIDDESVKEDTAKVKVTITTYDFGKAYQSMYNQIEKDAKNGKIDADTDPTEYIYDLMFKKMLGLKEKEYSKQITVKCTRNEDGDWETDLDSNEGFQDAILGGIITSSAGADK